MFAAHSVFAEEASSTRLYRGLLRGLSLGDHRPLPRIVGPRRVGTLLSCSLVSGLAEFLAQLGSGVWAHKEVSPRRGG